MFILFGNKLKYHLGLLESTMRENEALKKQVELLEESLFHERQERDKLQDCILKRTGFTIADNTTIPQATNKAIGRPVSSWGLVRKKLEAEANKKVAPSQLTKAPKLEDVAKEVDELIKKEEQKNAS